MHTSYFKNIRVWVNPKSPLCTSEVTPSSKVTAPASKATWTLPPTMKAPLTLTMFSCPSVISRNDDSLLEHIQPLGMLSTFLSLPLMSSANPFRDMGINWRKSFPPQSPPSLHLSILLLFLIFWELGNHISGPLEIIQSEPISKPKKCSS